MIISFDNESFLSDQDNERFKYREKILLNQYTFNSAIKSVSALK